MNNRVFDITSEGKKALGLALQIAFDNAPGRVAKFWRLAPTDQAKGIGVQITLFWLEDICTVRLPSPLDAEGATDMVWRWLQGLKDNELGQYIDLDGSLGRGWRVFCESWGKCGGSDYGFVTIEGVWAWYGK